MAERLLVRLEGDPYRLILFGTLGHFTMIVVGYGAINMVFGNIIEPNLLGRRLGLSTLVVILSLLFWAWIWGPVGAILAVPLTMVVKIMLENTEDLRWVAILLDKAPPQQAVGLPAGDLMTQETPEEATPPTVPAGDPPTSGSRGSPADEVEMA